MRRSDFLLSLLLSLPLWLHLLRPFLSLLSLVRVCARAFCGRGLSGWRHSVVAHLLSPSQEMVGCDGCGRGYVRERWRRSSAHVASNLVFLSLSLAAFVWCSCAWGESKWQMASNGRPAVNVCLADTDCVCSFAAGISDSQRLGVIGSAVVSEDMRGESGGGASSLRSRVNPTVKCPLAVGNLLVNAVLLLLARPPTLMSF